MEKHMIGLNVNDLMASFSTDATDVNAQQFARGSAYVLAIQKHQPPGKWALAALQRLSFYDTLEEALAVMAELPVTGAIYPPPEMKDMPEIPGFGTATVEVSTPKK